MLSRLHLPGSHGQRRVSLLAAADRAPERTDRYAELGCRPPSVDPAPTRALTLVAAPVPARRHAHLWAHRHAS